MDGSDRSRLAISCTGTYTFATTVAQTAAMPAVLAAGITGSRGDVAVRVVAPPLANPVTTDPAGEFHASLFEVTVQGHEGPQLPDATAALALADEVARDVFMQICLAWPSAGLAGLGPERTRYHAEVDGNRVSVDLERVPQRSGTVVLWGDAVEQTKLLAAINGETHVSTALGLAAQGQNHAGFRLDVNQSTGLVMAATAIEVAAHDAARALATDEMRRLVDCLIPSGEQAKISPKDVIDKLLPTLGIPRLSDTHPHLWSDVKQLFKQRDRIAHQGTPDPRQRLLKLATVARRCVEWIEAEVASVQASDPNSGEPTARRP